MLLHRILMGQSCFQIWDRS